MLQKKPEAFIFDWDNTLSDTWNVTMEVMNHVLVAFGKTPWTLDEIKKNTHHSAKDFFPKIFGDKSEDAFSILKTFLFEKREEFLSRLTPNPGAKDLLHYIHTLKIPCFILSNKQGDLLRLEVDKMEWAAYFKAIYGSLDFSVDKPDSLPVLEIRKRHNLSDKHIWFLGDTEVDWRCALNSGCISVKIGQPLNKDILSFPTCLEFLEYFSTYMKE